MGAKSTLSQLPKEVEKYFHGLISNKKYTQQQVADYMNAFIATLDLEEKPVITRDIVQKQAKNYNERLAITGAKLRRERELAQAVVHEIGCKPSVEQSQVLSALLQSMTTRLGMEMDDSEELPSPKELRELAQAHKIVTDSNKIIEQAVRQARAEEKAKVAEMVEKTAKSLGISEEKRDIIRADVLGMS